MNTTWTITALEHGYRFSLGTFTSYAEVDRVFEMAMVWADEVHILETKVTASWRRTDAISVTNPLPERGGAGLGRQH